MVKELEKHKASLEREKEKIRLKEKLLREKEKQKRSKGFVNIGRLASKVDIDLLETDVLLGAFIEISNRCNDEKVLQKWKEQAENFHKKESNEDHVAIAVCFKTIPDKVIKEQLKELGFRWNIFRKEFLGYGSKSTLQKLLNASEHTIEVLN